jgi:tripartite-type tricarboxylate transporter receptor subunit TctC
VGRSGKEKSLSIGEEETMPLKARALVFAALAATLAMSPAAAQQSVADFYKGKNVALLLGTGPGGSYDLYARIFAEHLSKHIPGNPTIVVEHMPGAGGVTAGNHLFGPGPQDGTKILLSHAIIMSEVLDPKAGVRFQSAKFNWVGTYDAIAHTMAFWHESKVKSLADLKKPGAVIGSFAKAHFTYQWPAMMKDVMGLDFKLITGYPTGNHNNLAMERGEIDGWAASWENLIGTRPHWIKEKKVTLVMQFLLERKHQIPDVPTLLELAPPAKKDVVEFMSASTPFGRGVVMGPGVPAERVNAMRAAFEATAKDPAFLAMAKQRQVDIDWRDHKHTMSLVQKIVGASPDLVTRVKKTIGLED